MKTNATTPVTLEDSVPPRSRRVYAAVFLAAVACRIGLLLTSQALPDGDEAVEGLMANHVLEFGIHPIYPYGVQYGAGAGVEVHLAAFLFRLFGCSEFNLKCTALIIWFFSCLALYAVAKKKIDGRTAWFSLLLYAWCPALPLYTLKLSGGHQLAVLAGLAALALIEDSHFRHIGAVLLPVSAYLHPIVAPFSLTLLLYGLYRERGNRRRLLAFLGTFAAACLLAWILLTPPGGGVHDPHNSDFRLAEGVSAATKILPWLFIPNLNGPYTSGSIEPLISFLWLIAVVAALIVAVRTAAFDWLFFMAGAYAAAFAVRPDLLAQRHLFMLYPLICILIAAALVRIRTQFIMKTAFFVLLVSGVFVGIAEMKSPYIYGPGVQASGVSRGEFQEIMSILEENHIIYVYSLDPMLQWNIIFASRERVLARWRDTKDRVPRYITQIDSARMAGEPVALVYSRQSPDRRQVLNVVLRPDQATLDRIFASSL